MPDAVTYSFGRFKLDTAAYRLSDGSSVIPAPPKVLDLLRLLVSQPAALVTKDAILAELWPDVAVTDNAITQVVSELRQALGDDAAAPMFVQTVPRRGYRFVGAVQVCLPAAAGVAGASVRRRRAIAVSTFQNVNNDADVAWLSSGIAETVSNDLRALRDLSVIDRAGLPEPIRRGRLEGARAASLDWMVVGGFQRSGDRLRMTARVIDVATGEAVAQAKADGLLSDAFGVQDQLITRLLADLQVPVSAAAAERIGTRETTSIDAYRAMTEGRIKLESLDPAQVPEAIRDFDHALTLDPRYALAYVGLAEARFWRHEASRARNKPDHDELRLSIAHARRAVELDAGLGEAHAALAFFLASAGQHREAVESGRRAIALEPNDWRHRFRLAAAAWGQERLTCLEEVKRLYPELAHTYVLDAMVHVARTRLGQARQVLELGLSHENTGRAGASRFPPNGLHWLLGLVRWADDGDRTVARAECERELAGRGSALYAAEYAMNACDALGFLALAEGRPADADAMFARALTDYPDHARSLIGRAQASAALRDKVRAASLLDHADRAIHELAAGGRTTESAMARACWLMATGDHDAACRALLAMLDSAPPGYAGWTIPIEPWLAPVRETPAFKAVVARLIERAD